MILNDMFCLIAATEPSMLNMTLTWLLVLGCMILPWILGWMIAKWVKMPDYAIHISFILWLLAISSMRIATGFPPKLGIDLKGGVILEYEVYPSEDGSPLNMDLVIGKIEDRLNSSGLKEISIRAVGSSRIEVIVPDVEPATVLSIKEMIHKAGLLEFRIVADPEKHRDVIELAEAQALTDPLKILVLDPAIADPSKNTVGKWVGLGREDVKGSIGDYKIRDFYRHTIRDATTGKIIHFAELPSDIQLEVTRANRPTSKARVDKIFEKAGYPKIEILMATNDEENVIGDDLRSTKTSTDEQGNPEVVFRIKSNAASRFASLTSKFKPDATTGRRFHLGIILDDELLSAPTIESTISDNGRITGKFSVEEVKSLVEILAAGTMKAKINNDPLRESQTSPLLGEDMINKSKWAMGIASVLVLLFMIAYYRFAGFIACLAVVANIFFTLALMIAMSAALTLTGIAGMVLTIGMAVDANVLIYERMREETAKGTSLRMAIRNGFDRAFTTILDSNLTTILTAVILYFIGTAQVKGFAVTLILGIATSMFTACYATRIAFDIAERMRWYRKINFAEWVGVPKFDYVKIMLPMTILSVVLIAIGMAAFFARGRGVYDIDFNGGTSVIATLNSKMEMKDVREKLNEQFEGVTQDNTKATYTLTGIRGVRNIEDGSIWKIDSSLLDEKQLQEIVKKAFSSPGSPGLVVHKLLNESFVQEEVVPIAVPPSKEEGKEVGSTEGASSAESKESTPESTTAPETKSETKPEGEGAPKSEPEKPAEPSGEGAKPASGADEPPATPKGQSSLLRSIPSFTSARAATTMFVAGILQEGDAKPAAQDSPKVDEKKTEEAKPTDPQKPDEKPADAPEAKVGQEAKESTPLVTSEGPQLPTEVAPPEAAISKKQLSRFLTRATLEFDKPIDGYVLREEIKAIAVAENVDLGDVDTKALGAQSNSSLKWEVSMRCEEPAAKQVIAKLKEVLPTAPVWASSDKITGQVAADAQMYAFIALLLSMVGIIAYVWFRFEKLSYGFAAVAALIHDVLITLAAIGISAYVAPYLGFLMIDEFKLNLPVVAAILTLIGYSINDTIVTFDRIREVRGKSPNLTTDMINLSVNQTMSRTLLTFLTVFIVVVILYIWGGESIHGFAFCMVVGSIAGVYSSIFIASPLLLWFRPKVSAAKK